MRFHYQTMSPSRPSDLVLQHRLIDRWKDVEHENPNALMEAVRAWGDEQKLGLTVTAHNGVINIHGPHGLLARVRTNS